MTLSKYTSLYSTADGREKIKDAFSAGWIGQGYGYKSIKAWNEFSDDEIIYIPEGAYLDADIKDVPHPEDTYTKARFIDLCFNSEFEDIHQHPNEFAETMFNDVDWQYPETLLDEWEREEGE
jgi:hypothetical protein